LCSRIYGFLPSIFRHGFVLHLRFSKIDSSNRARASLARSGRKKATGAFASVATMSGISGCLPATTAQRRCARVRCGKIF